MLVMGRVRRRPATLGRCKEIRWLVTCRGEHLRELGLRHQWRDRVLLLNDMRRLMIKLSWSLRQSAGLNQLLLLMLYIVEARIELILNMLLLLRHALNLLLLHGKEVIDTLSKRLLDHLIHCRHKFLVLRVL